MKKTLRKAWKMVCLFALISSLIPASFGAMASTADSSVILDVNFNDSTLDGFTSYNDGSVWTMNSSAYNPGNFIFWDTEHKNGSSMWMWSYGDGGSGMLNYLKLDKPVTGRVLLGYDYAMGYRISPTLSEDQGIFVVLGKDNLVDGTNHASLTDKGVALRMSTSSDGNKYLDNGGNDVGLNGTNANYPRPSNVNLIFGRTQTVNGQTNIGETVVMPGADKWYHIDLDIDMDNAKIDYYINGAYKFSSNIDDGVLPQLGYLQFRLPGTGWSPFEAYVDNVTLKRPGAAVNGTAALAGAGTVTADFDTAIVNVQDLTASQVSIKKCSDNSPVTVTGVEAVSGSSLKITYGGELAAGSEYKIILDDSVQFVGNGLYEPVAFNSPKGEGSWADVFEPETFTGMASITNAPGWKSYLENKGWTVDSPQDYGRDGWINSLVLGGNDAADTVHGDYAALANNNEWSANIEIARSFTETAENNVYRFQFDSKFASFNKNFFYLLLNFDGTLYNTLQIGQKEDGSKAVTWVGAPLVDTSWQLAEQISDITAWRTYTFELDMANSKLRYYNTDNVLVEEKNINANFKTFRGFKFAMGDKGTNYFCLDNISVKKFAYPATVDSVRFTDIKGKNLLPKDTVKAGTKGINITFSSEISGVLANDSRITIANGNTQLPYTGTFDAASNTYTMALDQPLTTEKNYTLSVDSGLMAGGYLQSFTTDAGTFEAAKPTIVKGTAALETVSAGDSLTISADVINTTASAKNTFLSYGFYREDASGAMQLIGFDCVTRVLAANEGLVTITFDNPPVVPEGTNVIKAFLWEDANDITPLTEYTEVR